MNYRFFFRHGVLNLPDSVLSSLAQADKLSVCALLYLAKYPDCDRETLSAKMRADGVLCSASQLKRAEEFWYQKGVLCDANAQNDEVASQKKSASLPIYESQELAQKLTEGESEIGILADDCQRLAGKMFTPTDLSRIVALVDYLGLSCAYVRTLYTYCIEKKEKRNVGYLQKMAQNLYDEGITTESALASYLEQKEQHASLEGKLRTMFGIGQRALTAKESQFISDWMQHGYDLELLRYAYDLTVEATGKVSFAYMDKILQNWAKDGITTAADAKKAQEAHSASAKAPQKKDKKTEKSFQTDEFFALALQRSYQKSQDTEGDAK